MRESIANHPGSIVSQVRACAVESEALRDQETVETVNTVLPIV